MTPLSAPFGGFYPRLRSLCRGLSGRFPAAGLSVLSSGQTRGQGRTDFHEPGETTRSTTLCAAQARPARSFGHQETKARSVCLHLSPCRRRETIFREPRMGGLTSFPPTRRRSRLAATPCGVSATERGDCRHGLGGRG